MSRKLFALVSVLTLLGLFASPLAEARVDVSVGVSVFYGELAPYGQWVTVADYGEVWCPRRVRAGWQPYLNGEWLYTDYGWTWVSYDPWGGDPYHYGTWAFTGDWGWVWIPGTVWAPAWVTWCWTGDSVGWAPVPPSLSIGLVGYSGPAVVAPARSYVFVPTRSFVGVDVQNVRVDPARNATFLSGAQKSTSFAVSGGVVRTGGPPLSTIRKVAGSTVHVSSIGQAKARPVAIAAAARGSRRLSVVAPAHERAVLKSQSGTHGGREAAQAARELGHGKKSEAAPARAPAPKTVMTGHAERPSQQPHETRAQAPQRKPEPRPETKLDPSVRHKEPPHETRAQAPQRKAEPPHETRAQAPPKKAEPPHEVRAQAPERKKPAKPENPGS